MEDKLNLYKDEELLKSENYVEGKANVTIDSLDADTDYPKGTYQVSRENENGESKKKDVPAFKTKPILVTGVTINKEALDLTVGDQQKITATVAPGTATDKSVEYSSSDKAVATVDGEGNITAVAKGGADITVTTTDGNKTAKCTVTITEKEVEEPEALNVETKTNSADVSAK